MKKDISEKVEVLKSFEEKFGIKISGIYCEMDFDDDEYCVKLNVKYHLKTIKLILI